MLLFTLLLVGFIHHGLKFFNKDFFEIPMGEMNGKKYFRIQSRLESVHAHVIIN